MSNYGILISKPGYDVSTQILTATSSGYSAANPTWTVYSSGWSVFKILVTGTTTISSPSTTVGPTSNIATATIAHGLSYVPQAGAFFSFDNGTTWRPNNGSTTNVSSSTQNATWVSADSTNIILKVFSYNQAAFTAKVRYMIYADAGT